MFTRISILGAVCGALTATAAVADPVVYDIVPLRSYTQLVAACPVGEAGMRCDTLGAIHKPWSEQLAWEFEGVDVASFAAVDKKMGPRMAPIENNGRLARLAWSSPAHSAFTVARARLPRYGYGEGFRLNLETMQSVDIATASIPSQAERKADAFVARMTEIHAAASQTRQAAAAAEEGFMTQLALAKIETRKASDLSMIETASVPQTGAQRAAAMQADAFVARMTAIHEARRVAMEKAERFLSRMAAVNAADGSGIATASIPTISAEQKADAFVARMTEINEARRVAMEKADRFLARMAARSVYDASGIATATIPQLRDVHGFLPAEGPLNGEIRGSTP